jgi:CMP-N-acetylneuraminic acid synthetase
MRHHSQRVPGKNFRTLGGKPLFHHILETLLAVPEIHQIAVDTDSDVVISGLQEHFPGVLAIRRPDQLRADDVPMNLVLEHDTAQVQADFYLQTHATNPLLRPESISRGIRVFLEHYPGYDSLFSVTALRTRLYDESGKAINHDPAALIQTQDLPPIYEENSCLYLFTRANLVARHHRIGKHPFLFEIPSAEAWDIDDELDFEICEFLLQRNKRLAERTS